MKTQTKVNNKKALIWGTVVWFLQVIVGNVLYMNPLVQSVNAKYAGHPTIKSFDFIGGMGNWLLLTFAFGIAFIAFSIFLYIKLYNCIPGEGWKKGLYFGFILGLLKSVPEAFNQWMLFVYPGELILVQLFNTLAGVTIFGLLLGYIYARYQVIQVSVN